VVRRWVSLLAAVAVLAVLWLGVFPLLARTAPAAAHIREMQAGRVNPGAMFYSELEDAPFVSVPLVPRPE